MRAYDPDDPFREDPPTGVERVWRCDIRLAPVIAELVEALEIAQSRGDAEEYGRLREQLTSLPGHPPCSPGDGIALEWVMPQRALVSVPGGQYGGRDGTPKGWRKLVVAKG